jgi:hypothetical protein
MEEVYVLFENDSLPVQLFHSHCVYLIVALEGLKVVDFVQRGGISHPLQVESNCRLTITGLQAAIFAPSHWQAQWQVVFEPGKERMPPLLDSLNL